MIQTILLQLIIYLLSVSIRVSSFSLKMLLLKCLPINYYTILYCSLYIISPYINLVLDNLSKCQLKKMIFVSMILFSIMPTTIDLFYEITGKSINGLNPIGLYGSQYGYSIINFILLYTLGAFVKKCKIFSKYSTFCIWVGVFLCSFLLTLWAYFNKVTGYSIERSAWEYCNPFVILECLLVLVAFLKMEIPYFKQINALAKSTFTVYLCHISFLKLINIKLFFSYNPICMILSIMLVCIFIYFLCYVIDFLYKKVIMKNLLKIEKKYPIYFFKE